MCDLVFKLHSRIVIVCDREESLRGDSTVMTAIQ